MIFPLKSPCIDIDRVCVCVSLCHGLLPEDQLTESAKPSTSSVFAMVPWFFKIIDPERETMVFPTSTSMLVYPGSINGMRIDWSK